MVIGEDVADRNVLFIRSLDGRLNLCSEHAREHMAGTVVRRFSLAPDLPPPAQAAGVESGMPAGLDCASSS